MAIDNRTTRLGMLALVSPLLIGAARNAPVVPAGRRSGRVPGEGRLPQSCARCSSHPSVAASSTPTVRVLADNQRILTVAIDWSIISKTKVRTALFERLSGPLKVPVIDLQRRYEPCFGEPAIPKCTKGQRYSTLLPLPLKEDVDEDTVNYLKERSEDFPGIQIVEQWKRVYPYSPLASHVVGYLGPITEGDQEALRGRWLQHQRARRRVRRRVVDGVRVLHGTWGKQVFEVDAAGGIVRELIDQHVDPVAGKDIQLTIDLDMQQYAEQALETKLLQRRHLPTDILGQDVAAHNPIDPKRPEGVQRVYSSSKEFGTQEWIQYKAPAGSVVVEDNSERSDPGDGQLPDVRQPLDRGTSAATSSSNCSARRSIRRPARPTPTSRSSSTAPCRAATTWVRRSSRSSRGPRCTAVSSGPTSSYRRPGRLQARVDSRRHLRKRRALRVQERNQHSHSAVRRRTVRSRRRCAGGQ